LQNRFDLVSDVRKILKLFQLLTLAKFGAVVGESQEMKGDSEQNQSGADRTKLEYAFNVII
jgi:hypothetical protein